MQTKIPQPTGLTLVLLLSMAACSSPGEDQGTSEETTGLTTSTSSPTTGEEPTTTTGDTTDATTTSQDPPEPALLRLTILHNNDAESQLIHAGTGLEDFGGAARFVSLHDQLRSAADMPDDDERSYAVLTLSSGDNFLAGPEFAVSYAKGPPFFDAQVLTAIGYDAVCIGNHDFDFGPNTLADFITGVAGQVPFLSANLDMSAEPELAALTSQGRIAKSTVIGEDNRRIGIVGATTPMLKFISSPGQVEIDSDVTLAIQTEVDALTALGVNKIIVISHLQSISEELALAPLLRDVDIMIAGGGDELLANPGDLVIPGDEDSIYGPYPLESANGVPVVTTRGNYRYLGRLVVDFDSDGELVAIDASSGVVRVAGGDQPDAVPPDPTVQAEIVDPLVAALADLAGEVVAVSEVALDGTKTALRTGETNLGNLVADALLWQAKQLAADNGVPVPTVALQNGGGIRNDSILPVGDISALDTFDILPFPNFVAVVPGVTATEFKALLENAVSRVEQVDGRFAQIAGFRFTYDPAQPAREVDAEGMVIEAGQRVQEVVLADETVLVQAGQVDPGAPTLTVATINFLAQGGDQYPFTSLDFVALGVSYQQALANFLTVALSGTVGEDAYPSGGDGRISEL